MVTTTLSPEMENAGRDLTLALDEAGGKVNAALWLFLSDQNSWRLILASPEVKTRGPRAVYKKVQRVLSRCPCDGLEVQDISVIDPDDPLVNRLRAGVRTDSGPGVRFSRTSINGHFIEDAFIYRVR
ncbi:MAG: hypothetical protein ACR2OZ_08440 [Verrucomicrobiales bacterium]